MRALRRGRRYVTVYYRGSNDAWDGYGGAVVYSKEPVLPAKWIPEIAESLKKARNSHVTAIGACNGRVTVVYRLDPKDCRVALEDVYFHVTT